MYLTPVVSFDKRQHRVPYQQSRPYHRQEWGPRGSSRCFHQWQYGQ
jgi:hypothetical protein